MLISVRISIIRNGMLVSIVCVLNSYCVCSWVSVVC